MKVRESNVLKHAAIAEIRAVEDILRRWDPSNVTPGVGGPADEYDSYAPHIVSMVKSGCTIEEPSAPLERLCIENMALGKSSPESRAYSLEFAGQIVSRVRQASVGNTVA